MQQTVDAIRDWFRQCPLVSSENRFGVDNMGADPTEYAIYMAPSALVTATDITGAVYVRTVQERSFTFASRNKHPADVLQSLANHGFYDGIITWMIQQNKAKNFPEIPDGVVTAIIPTTTQYLFEAGANSGRYQISCKMKYRRNA